MITENLICPICNKETVTVKEERVGPPGYRESEYDVINTCECRLCDFDYVALGIISYNVNIGHITTIYNSHIVDTNSPCMKCGENNSALNYYYYELGGDTSICVECFIKEIEDINRIRDEFKKSKKW